MQIQHTSHRSTDVVRVIGDIDLYTAPQLRAHLVDLIDTGPRDVVLDLSQVAFLDSSALGVFVGAHKRARAGGGAVRLAGPSAVATKMLRVTGLIKVFHIYPDLDSALAASPDVGEA